MNVEQLVGTIACWGGGIVALVLILKHKRDLAKIANGTGADSADVNALRTRCDSLEKRCEKLEEQVISAHTQLADERRELDHKLASMLPDAGPARFLRRRIATCA